MRIDARGEFHAHDVARSALHAQLNAVKAGIATKNLAQVVHATAREEVCGHVYLEHLGAVGLVVELEGLD